MSTSPKAKPSTTLRVSGYSVLLSALAVLVTVLAILTPLPSLAAPVSLTKMVPTVGSAVMLGEDQVRLTFRFPKGVIQSKGTLVIERTLNGKKLRNRSVAVAAKRTSLAVTEDLFEFGLYTFRAKVSIGKRSSQWSTKIAITIAEPLLPTPAPGVTPTPRGMPAIPAAFSECADLSAQQISLNETNLFRGNNGKTTLVRDERLYFAAIANSILMAQSKVRAHMLGAGASALDYGWNTTHAGQNVADIIRSPSEVVKGWTESESHRRNMLATDYTRMGIGCVADETGKFWWTQNFAS